MKREFCHICRKYIKWFEYGVKDEAGKSIPMHCEFKEVVKMPCKKKGKGKRGK
jgi:hypothetical protein